MVCYYSVHMLGFASDKLIFLLYLAVRVHVEFTNAAKIKNLLLLDVNLSKDGTSGIAARSAREGGYQQEMDDDRSGA